MNLLETVRSTVGNREAELRQWGSRLDHLLAKSDATSAGGGVDYRQRLEDLKDKFGAAEVKLAELKAAGSGKWETFKEGIETAWSELATAFTRVAN